MTDAFLSGDKPLTEIKDDRLGFASYSEYLAQVIARQCPNSGLVMAICGEWGTGKSTLINFMLRSLDRLPTSERPQVIHFNPWLFSGESDLTRRFFEQLEGTFKKWGKTFKTLRSAVADYGEVVEKAPLPYAGFAGIVRIMRPKAKDVVALKEAVAALLLKEPRRILIVVDDVDRLTAEEVRQLFRVIKAVADFPNTTYLLAFDRPMVIKALEHEQGTDGEAYLEKIVQATFNVPRVEPSALHRILFEGLDRLLDGAPNERFDQTRWGNIFHEGMKHYLETPRDVTRLVNVLSITYPPLKDEVNPVDFFALETLRLFCPDAYSTMRDKPEQFTGVEHLGFLGDSEKKTTEAFHNDWLGRIPRADQEAVKRFMIRLFPRLEGIWGGMNYGSDFMPTWRKALRVCSPSRCPVYFQYSLPSGYVSNQELEAALKLMGDPSAFGKLLLKLSRERNPSGTSRLRTFLEILTDYSEKDIPTSAIVPLLTALLTVGDQLLLECDDRQGFSEFGGNELRIHRLLWPLLRRVSREERFEALRTAFTQGRAAVLMADIVTVLGGQHGMYGEEKPQPQEEQLVAQEHVGELEKLAVERIREAAEAGSLLESPLFTRTMNCWATWAGEDEPRKWVQTLTATDKGLALFISKYGNYTTIHAFSDSVARRRFRLNPAWLKKFLDPASAIDRVRALATNPSFPEPIKLAMAQYAKEYDLAAAGKDPDSPFMQDKTD